ncbi:extracellular solute-binding protein [Paenibacillus tritici]|uniref:Extracellular solute-binding protein n=1 Tax=Paenibacillus tritici TaxID=1873425 RepID=A0ABX2DLE9_9BACL|nr:extracellular solute-binding protein [Paenibacillus tritici]NQX45458.1 extracellular solute-binding protein [Paenibacillus tritici]
MKTLKTRIIVYLKFLILLTLMTGCSNSGNYVKQTIMTIKVLLGNESILYKTFEDEFEREHPNINLSILINPSSSKYASNELTQLLKQEQPDLIFLTPEQYQFYSNKNFLYQLDDGIDKNLINGTIPVVNNYIKSLSNGKQFGTANSFFSKAIYYNKKIFLKNNIPFPEDNITWEKIFSIAEEFNLNNELGISFNAIGQDRIIETATYIGEGHGLQLIDFDKKKVLINSEQWLNIFRILLKSLHSNSLELDRNNQDFLSGKIAMMVSDSSLANVLKKKYSKKDLDWDVIGIPNNKVISADSSFFGLPQIISIGVNSKKIEESLDFIEFINSSFFFESLSKTPFNIGLPSKRVILEESDNKNMKVFYEFKIKQSNPIMKTTLQKELDASFKRLAEIEINKTYLGSVPLQFSLLKIKELGEQLLKKSHLNDNNNLH